MTMLSKTDLNIGFVPLTDSAPLIIAREFGFFERWGLQVNLLKQNSWATLRDKLHAGLLDAAQMLAPMPLASSLGLGVASKAVISPLVLSLNGNGITISEALYKEILHANKLHRAVLPMAAYLLKAVIEQRKQRGQEKLKFANVFPYSCHFYQLLDWLRSADLGLSDVDILVVPPVSMVGYLESGDIDGFCVGGPWNAKAVRAGIGVTALTSYDIWQDSPEKVLGLSAQFYDQYPDTTLALCAAIKQSCDWLGTVPNRFEAARVLSQTQYLDAALDVIAPSLIGSCLTQQGRSPRQIPAYNQFSASAMSVHQPKPVRAEWLLKQMALAGQLHQVAVPTGLAAQVFRLDIYQQVEDLLAKETSVVMAP